MKLTFDLLDTKCHHFIHSQICDNWVTAKNDFRQKTTNKQKNNLQNIPKKQLHRHKTSVAVTLSLSIKQTTPWYKLDYGLVWRTDVSTYEWQMATKAEVDHYTVIKHNTVLAGTAHPVFLPLQLLRAEDQQGLSNLCLPGTQAKGTQTHSEGKGWSQLKSNHL